MYILIFIFIRNMLLLRTRNRCSTILYDAGPGETGVRADAVVETCLYLCSPAGAALNGVTLRTYGTAGFG